MIMKSYSFWWQYFVVVLMFVLSFSFYCAGHVESIVFDKVKHQLQLWRTSLYCVKKVKTFPLDEIEDVLAFKKGHSGINVYTLHYKIVVVFRGNGIEPIKLMETGVEEKCIKQVMVFVVVEVFFLRLA